MSTVLREYGSIGPRHDCRELGAHVHLNSFSRCSQCGHSYDSIHEIDKLCVWCYREAESKMLTKEGETNV